MIKKVDKIIEIKNNLKESLNNQGIKVGDKFEDYPTAVDNFNPWEDLGYDSTLWEELKQDIKNSNKELTYTKRTFVTDGTHVIAHFDGDDDVVYFPEITVPEGCTAITFGYMNGFPKLKYVQWPKGFAPTYMISLFDSTAIETPPKDIDYSACTLMNQAFQYSHLKEFPATTFPAARQLQFVFRGCHLLTKVGEIYAPKCRTLIGLFNNCSSLNEYPPIDSEHFPNVTMAGYLSYSQTDGEIDLPLCTQCYQLYDVSRVNRLKSINIPKCSDAYQVIHEGGNLEAVTDFFDISGMAGFYEGWTYAGYNHGNNTLSSCYFRGFGTNSKCTVAYMNELLAWGNDEEYYYLRDHKDYCKYTPSESVIETLVNGSFDRAAAGYDTCTVLLAPYAYNCLTADHITTMNNKGYSVVLVEDRATLATEIDETDKILTQVLG
jgi:hypothetical protein